MQGHGPVELAPRPERPFPEEARRERVRHRPPEHEVAIGRTRPSDVLGEDRPQRLGHRNLADAGSALWIFAARDGVPRVCDGDVRDAVLEAVQVRNAQRLELASTQAREQRRCPHCAVGLGQRVEQLERPLRRDDVLAPPGRLRQVEPVGRIGEHLPTMTPVEGLESDEHPTDARPGRARADELVGRPRTARGDATRPD